MIRPQLCLIALLLSTTYILAQPDTTLTPNPEDFVSYLEIDCDSSGLDIFVDDILVGQSPINSPIPVKPGVHTVTYLNPKFITLLKQYYENPEIESILSRSLQRVYVIPGKTLTVNLWWKPYEKYLIKRKLWVWIKTAVGLVVVSVLYILNL